MGLSCLVLAYIIICTGHDFRNCILFALSKCESAGAYSEGLLLAIHVFASYTKVDDKGTYGLYKGIHDMLTLFKQYVKLVMAYLVGKYICPQKCVFSDIFGADLTRRVVAFCMGIAICHRQKFGQVWGSPAPLPEVAGKRDMITLLQWETPEFIPPPGCRIDCRLLCVGVLQYHVYCMRMTVLQLQNWNGEC